MRFGKLSCTASRPRYTRQLESLRRGRRACKPRGGSMPRASFLSSLRRVPVRFQLLASIVLLVIGPWLHSAWAQPPQPKQQTKPPKPPDAAEINRLIQQLGSKKFGEREAANKALQAIGPPAVEGLRQAAAQHKDPEVRRRISQLLNVMENSLEQLVVDYQAYGLPLPPKDAKLVWLKIGSTSSTDNKLDQNWFVGLHCRR